MAEPLVNALRERVAGRVAGPDDAGWDVARGAYNLVLDQRPEAVVHAASEDDVVAVVRVAAERGLRVAPQGTGHGAGALADLAGAILLRVDDLGGVEVDPDARRVRARAGACWADVAAEADRHGLAALAGTAGDVRVAGYTLGGGLGWLARRHGLAANSVTAAEVVTADGRRLRVDAETEPDLFWALRGGGGSFAVVTALELELFPAPDLQAGVLFWPMERAADVLHAWREWTASVPDELTSIGRLLQFPPVPELPDHLRGQAFAVVEAALLGTEAEADALLAPLRALGPAMDTVAAIPPSALGLVHMDPPEPVPYAADGGLLATCPREAVDAVLALGGPGSGSPLVSLELRHLGGALAAPGPGAGAAGALEAEIAWFAVGIAPGAEALAAVDVHVDRVHTDLAPWADTGRHYLNFAERPIGSERLFGSATHARLCEVRAAYDPEGRFLANHPVTA
jgi:FAD/FMN-containing dehydrogenase